MHYQDLLYDERDGVATITINRPQVHNAFRAATCEELIHAFTRAGDQRSIGVIVLTGAGDKAFCSGGDQSGTDTSYGGRGAVGLPIEPVHSLIRDVPQPVIARVQGYCIGGGNVLATLCDLTIASDRAVFGQAGPKMGSVDPGFGTAYLARVIGEKKAREMWYLCRKYSAAEALSMGLANVVVPHAQLDAEVARWCGEILDHSPTALTIAKRSFNADSEAIRGAGRWGFRCSRCTTNPTSVGRARRLSAKSASPIFANFANNCSRTLTHRRPWSGGTLPRRGRFCA